MIELVFFLHHIVNLMLENFNANLYKHKSYHLNATTQPPFNTLYEDEKRKRLFLTEPKSYFYWAVYMGNIVFITLATSWSDLSGKRRRPLIFLAISCQILRSINGLTHWFFWDWSPMAAVNTNLIFEYFGGVNMMFVMAQIYICDMSAAENRTMRLGILWAIKAFCLLMSEHIVALLFNSSRLFQPLYTQCLLISIISLLLALLVVKDISVVPDIQHGVLQIFNVTRISHSFKVVFKTSMGKKRLFVFISIIAYVAINFALEGEKAVFPPFIREHKYSLFLRKFADIFGTLFCSFILSKCFRMRDVSIGIFAGIFNIIGVISYLLDNEEWVMYAATLIYAFNGAILSVTVSFLSKFYESDKMGRLIGVLNIFWLVVTPSGWMYSKIFAATNKSFPSAFFFISLILNIAAFVLHCTSLAFWRSVNTPS